MKTLGIDPGTAIMGFGIIEEVRGKYITYEYGCFRTQKTSPPAERLLKLFQMLEAVIKKHSPDHIAVERLFFTSNSKTAISVGEARGIVLLSSARFGIPVSEYTPLQVKLSTTGYGKADKRQVQHMVKALLSLDDIPRPDDTADALAIAICHINSYNLEKEAQSPHPG